MDSGQYEHLMTTSMSVSMPLLTRCLWFLLHRITQSISNGHATLHCIRQRVRRDSWPTSAKDQSHYICTHAHTHTHEGEPLPHGTWSALVQAMLPADTLSTYHQLSPVTFLSPGLLSWHRTYDHAHVEWLYFHVAWRCSKLRCRRNSHYTFSS